NAAGQTINQTIDQTINTSPIVARSAAGTSTTAAAASTNAVATSITKAGTATTKPGASTTTTTPGETSCQALIKSSAPDTDTAKQVVLPDRKRTSCYVLGPVLVTGKSVSRAGAQYDSTTSQWVTNVHFK